MNILKPLLISILVWECGSPSVWAAENCDPERNRDLPYSYFYKDAKKDGGADSPNDRGVKRAAEKRCTEISDLFQELKTAADLDQLARIHQKMIAMQPAVHPQDKNDPENTFSLYLRSTEARDAAAIIASYKEVLALQEKAKLSGQKLDMTWSSLPQEEKKKVIERNEELGRQAAKSVATIQAVNNKFGSNTSGAEMASRFKLYVEKGKTYGQEADVPAESDSGAVVLGANAARESGDSTLPERQPVLLDGSAPPAPKTKSSAPEAGQKESPISPLVPVTGVLLMAAGAIGIGYERARKKALEEAESTRLTEHLSGITGSASAGSPEALADNAPAVQPPAAQQPTPQSKAQQEKQIREELAREGITGL